MVLRSPVIAMLKQQLSDSERKAAELRASYGPRHPQMLNAQSEVGTRHVRDIRTSLTPVGQGRWLLNGTKGYSTGALFADWIPVLAHLDTLAAPGAGPQIGRAHV